MNPIVEDILMHYGIPRRSGRYPWGSGEDPYQHNNDFLSRVDNLRKQNFTYTDDKGKTWTGDTAIAKSMGLSTTEFRTELSFANTERRMLDVARIKSLKEDGKGWTEIGREMGISESTVRSLYNDKSEARMREAINTADFLRARSKEVMADGGMLDVGTGVERELNVSKEKLNTALYILKKEGYGVYSGRFPQVTNPGQFTTQKVLCPPHIKPKEGAKVPKEIYDLDKIHTVKEYISRDNGQTYEKKFTYPESMDSSRLKIRYKEEGGLEKDGIVELRRGVEDLSLGESRYSQVRILVDGTHYIKGMAIYSDDMPPGVDVVFNTNKKQGTPMTSVLKEIKNDPDNPFGSAIKDADKGGQYWYNDSKTGEKKLGLINKRADEGDWSEWKDALPSQFLSKQLPVMATKQLKLARLDKEAEYADICALNNPTIKKHFLQKFADSCDASAVNLQAAALPGQKYHVIIPVNSLKDTEIYAPNYENGTKLALIRYPHGGTFEIPIVTVNNKHVAAKKLLGTDITDAVGINSKVAERLSGADFDGDTVMCIPTDDAFGRVKIQSKPALKDLEGFDAKTEYGPESYAGRNVRLMPKSAIQNQMGTISNLITDMTLLGANEDELARAVKHSMVVIDAYKHKLDYKQSELDNNISALHKTYQGKATGGAATIVSKSKGQKTVERRQGQPKINIKGKEWYDPSRPEGALIYKTADDLYYPEKKYDKSSGIMTIRTADGKKVTYNVKNKTDADYYNPIKKVNDDGSVIFTNKDGSIIYRNKARTQKSTKMAETDDAYSLVSEVRHPMELIYADHANNMKAMANKARVEMVNTGKIAYDKNAAKVYEAEVHSLNEKLKTALLNKTRERAAGRMAAAEINRKKIADPDMDSSDVKKASQRALTKYRDEVGSVRRSDRAIQITDREWEAIQAGAISEKKLKDILDNTDVDALRERAMPRTTSTLNSAQISRIKAMQASNYTLEEIARKFGKSPSTISKYLK